MHCKHCARSILGMATEYRAGCGGCQSRAVARCDAMRAYMTGRDDEREAAKAMLPETCAKAMPALSFRDAMQEAHRWWLTDQANARGRELAATTEDAT